MKKEITIKEAQKLTSPNPFALLGTGKTDGSFNLMAVSWWMYTGNNPASLAVCLSNKGLSGDLIKEGKIFSLSVVSSSLKKSAFQCGTCSGRTHDKIAEFGIDVEKDEASGMIFVKDARLNFILQLTEAVTFGDHTLYLANVRKILGDPEKPALFAMKGYGELDTL